MNVTQVSAANTQFKAGKTQEIVKFISKSSDRVDGEFVTALTKKLPDIENLAKLNNISEVKIASHGDNYLINTGALTSYIEKTRANNAEGLYSAIEENIIANKTPARSLGNGFNA